MSSNYLTNIFLSLIILVSFIPNIQASDLYSGKKNKDRGNIDLVNAIDNGIASYIVATNKITDANSSVTDTQNFYTCDISSIKSTIMGNPEKNGTFAYIIHSNKIRVGIGSDNDDCSAHDSNNKTPACNAFEHALEYINNTYKHLKKDLNIKPVYKIVRDSGEEVQEELENDKIDIYISEITLRQKEFNKGLLIGCSYATGTAINQDDQTIGTKAFLFRRDYDTNSKGERTLLGNDFLVDAFNAGFVDWKANHPIGTDSQTNDERRSYKELVQDVFGFWDERYQELNVAKSTYPSLTLTNVSTAFKNILFGHYIIAWMPNFLNQKNDCYIGEHSTVGLEKTVLKEVFYKISEHYGRRVEIMYFTGGSAISGSTYNQIKQFQTNPALAGASIFIDTFIPYAEYYKYVQFGGEFFTNTITPVFSNKKYCYSGSSDENYEYSCNLGLNDVKKLTSLTELMGVADKICIDKTERSIVKNLVDMFTEDKDKGKFISASINDDIIGGMMTLLKNGQCDLLLADFGTVQHYFFNKTQSNKPEDLEGIFQITSTGTCKRGDDCEAKLLTDFSYQFQFAPAFKRDKDNSNVGEIKDNESIVMSWTGFATATIGIGLTIASIFVSRGIVTRCIARKKEQKHVKGANNMMKSSHLIVEPTLIGSRTGNNNVGPMIENDW